MNTINFLLLIMMTLLCFIALSAKCYSILPTDNLIHKANKYVRIYINKYHILLVAILMLVALFVRAYKFGTIPYGFNQDEAMAALEGLTLSNYGTDHYGMSYPVYFTAWIVSQMNVLLSYIMIPFFKIFGASVFSARLPLLVFSIISLWVIYRFTSKIFGKNTALAVLFFTAINPWQIMMSRWALEANLFPHFMLYGAYLLYLGLEKRKVYLYLSMLVFGISMYSYGISYYAVPLFLIVACIYLLRTKLIKWKHAAICLLCYLAISWPIFLMTAVNYFKWETIEISFLTIPLFKEGQRMNDILIFSDNIYEQFVLNFGSLTKAAFFQMRDLPWNSIPEYGPLYFCSIPLFISGLYLIIKKFRKSSKDDPILSIRKTGIFLILMFFVIALVSGLITNYVNINRTNIIFFPMIIFIGYTIYTLCKRFNLLTIPIALIFILLFSGFSTEYFKGSHADHLGYNFYHGFGDSLEYVKDKEYDTIYITAKTQGEEAYFVSEILTLFHLEIDNEYFRDEAILKRPDGSNHLRYGRRYKYGIDQYAINPANTTTLYVIHTSEQSYFDEQSEHFIFVPFGSYFAVLPKTN